MKVEIEIKILMDTMLCTPLFHIERNVQELVSEFEKIVEKDSEFIGPLSGTVDVGGSIVASLRMARQDQQNAVDVSIQNIAE